MEFTDHENELICRLVQKLKLDSMCNALSEAYPTDSANDTKNKVTEIAGIMQKLKSAGFGC